MRRITTRQQRARRAERRMLTRVVLIGFGLAAGWVFLAYCLGAVSG